MQFVWHAIIILSVGYILIRISGKKTVGEMTGLEIITLLATASMIGHAMPDHGVLKTMITLCIFTSMLILIQYLSFKFDTVEKWALGKASLVILDGKIIPANLRKLRMSVDQLEAKLREKGISSLTDIKTATIEISGEIGFQLTEQAKPITGREFQQVREQLAQQNLLLRELKLMHPSLPITQYMVQEETSLPSVPSVPPNLFDEVIKKEHSIPIDTRLD